MSSRRRRSRRSPPRPTVAGDELVSRLRALLPPGASTSSTAYQVLEETVAYVRRLHAEVDGLAERLARLLEDHQPSAAGGGHGAAHDDDDGAQLIIRALLM